MTVRWGRGEMAGGEYLMRHAFLSHTHTQTNTCKTVILQAVHVYVFLNECRIGSTDTNTHTDTET